MVCFVTVYTGSKVERKCYSAAGLLHYARGTSPSTARHREVRQDGRATIQERVSSPSVTKCPISRAYSHCVCRQIWSYNNSSRTSYCLPRWHIRPKPLLGLRVRPRPYYLTAILPQLIIRLGLHIPVLHKHDGGEAAREQHDKVQSNFLFQEHVVWLPCCHKSLYRLLAIHRHPPYEHLPLQHPRLLLRPASIPQFSVAARRRPRIRSRPQDEAAVPLRRWGRRQGGRGSDVLGARAYRVGGREWTGHALRKLGFVWQDASDGEEAAGTNAPLDSTSYLHILTCHKWFYAFSIAPHTPDSPAQPRPPNATANPFTEHIPHKRPIDDDGENFRWGNNGKHTTKRSRTGKSHVYRR